MDSFLASIIQVGAIGGVLVWFMLRLTPMMEHLEKVTTENSERNNEHMAALTKVIGLAALAQDTNTLEMKRQLAACLSEVDTLAKKRPGVS